MAVDLSNFANPTIVGTLETPQVHPQYGGVNPIFRVVQAGPSLLYVGGTSNKPGAGNTGVGRIQAVDITNPAAMKVTAQVSVPGTVHFYAPQIQGKTAVGIGNTNGSAGSLTANPGDYGNIVVATFDMTDPKYPTLLASVKTNYVVGVGDGATRIGNNLFAFAGVTDPANGLPLLLVVDATDPKNPGIQATC